MKIHNSVPVQHINMQPVSRKHQLQAETRVESKKIYPSVQNAISAYTVISEAHQLVTMAINVSFELIQKAFSSGQDRNEIMTKIATINNYVNRISPGFAEVANIPQYGALQETHALLRQLDDAIIKNDMVQVEHIQSRLAINAQQLDEGQKQLLTTIHGTDTADVDIDLIKKAIMQNSDVVSKSHSQLQHKHVGQLLLL